MTVAATFAEALDLMVREGLQSVSVGGQTVTRKNIEELIKGDQYAKGQAAAAAARGGLGVRTQRIVPYYP
jgi:hypothetical protein